MNSQKSLKVLLNTAHNFPDFPGVAYFLRYLHAGIEAAGIDVDYALGFGAGAGTLNILVEPFDDAVASQLLENKARSGNEYILVATEFLTGDTLNAFGGPETADATHYSRDNTWRMRHDAFMKAASGARAVWVTTVAQAPAFREKLPDIPVLPIPLSYAPALNHIPKGDQTKYYDVLFLGAQTPYRQALLQDLRSDIAIETPPFLPDMLYHPIASQARICLHLKLQAAWPFTSVIRHHSLLHAATYIVSEACDVPGELDTFIETVPADGLSDLLRERLADPDLALKAQRMKANFMRHGSLRQEFRTLLSESFD
ncbi:MAG: hypothetical protein NXI16_01630 [Alphaproteobacteria bacterium]|nr:hypothetical protein [Alphaproteobacteria bacterium]